MYINGYGAGGGIELPFGGMKKSGHGREKGFEALLLTRADHWAKVEIHGPVWTISAQMGPPFFSPCRPVLQIVASGEAS